ncbi:hypothetical protein D1BOALGB6SA_2910 [Olavius sp. associated proteobacterium Delta 1]|nr:hypothetical protein D1BOALGB6SA_2910 [Olavius sp. associated proteobacterium Delta 1]
MLRQFLKYLYSIDSPAAGCRSLQLGQWRFLNIQSFKVEVQL